MGSSTLDDAFGGFLQQSGFEPMSSPGMYRATWRADASSAGQNVFVSIGDSDDLSVMCPIGSADELNVEDLDVARDSGDRCTLEVVGSFGAFVRPLDINDFVTQPSNLVERAVELAQYTELVRDRLGRNQARKVELLELLQGWSNDPDSVSNGRVSPERFEAAVRETLALIPKQGLLDEILKDSMNENMRHWATSGVAMNQSPWREVVNRLQAIKSEHGWVSDVEQDFFLPSSDGSSASGVEEQIRGNVWNMSSAIAGSVEADGSVWDPGLTKLGSVDPDGRIWTLALYQIGSVDNNGWIWNTSVERLGSIDANGTIWNESHEQLGSVDRGLSARQAGAAALLLRLLPLHR